jgi:hypothetical protein
MKWDNAKRIEWTRGKRAIMKQIIKDSKERGGTTKMREIRAIRR